MPARRLPAFVLCPLLLAAAGCRSNSDLVEAELRTKEFQLRNLHDELHHLKGYNEALQREVQAIRGGPAVWVAPEAAAQVCPVTTLTFGRPTGGVDEDGCPGDEALAVLVEPRDAHGHALKAPGTLLLAAQEVLPEGLKKPLCEWQVPPEVLQRNWRSGLLTNGYSLVLPWKAWPTTERLRVTARFLLADGRAFEAEKDVSIRITPIAQRKPPPPEPTPASVPTPRLPAPPLPPLFVPPMPRPVEPSSQSQRVPLSEAVELQRPIAIPQRVEWAR